ncbi:MAG: hypothetical protein LC746_09220 [Acidobacteria bacterium]|nr:hypothetical protein [Acidobacteriota bacterium]
MAPQFKFALLFLFILSSSVTAQKARKSQPSAKPEPAILREVADVKPPIKAELWVDTVCGATGVITKDSAGRYLLFYLHRDYVGKDWKVLNVSVGEMNVDKEKPDDGLNFKRDLPIGGDEEKLLLKMLQQWRDSAVPAVRRLRILRILSLGDAEYQKESSRLSEADRKLLPVLLVIKDLESR